MFGRLFSTHHNEANKTEIILLITPHIVRNLTRLDARMSEFPAGTEADIGGAPLSLRQAPAAVSPVSAMRPGVPVAPVAPLGLPGAAVPAPAPLPAPIPAPVPATPAPEPTPDSTSDPALVPTPTLLPPDPANPQ